MEKVIMHSDLNCFYASVEMNEHPEFNNKKVAVCGSVENRHGIVLTASYPAKRVGVRTGMANWEAERICPGLIIVEPHYELYIKYSKMVRKIYSGFADDIEPYGMDECWLAADGCSSVEEDGKRTAEEIRRAVKKETGLTVSVGVSFSKIFAKLGSDLKKPDAVTVIGKNDYRHRIWPLPASDLLYVGRATTRKLRQSNIRTIGDIAACGEDDMRRRFGKNGAMLWQFANGTDYSPVMPANFSAAIISVGHGITCVRDMENNYEVWRVIYELTQDIGHRLRQHGLSVGGVQITVKDNEFHYGQYSAMLIHPTRSPLEIAQLAYALFLSNYSWDRPIRAITVSGIYTDNESQPVQLDMFGEYALRKRRRDLDDAVDDIRSRFGYHSITPASLMGELLMAKDRCELVTMPSPMYR